MKLSTFLFATLFSLTFFVGCTDLVDEVPTPDFVAHVSNQPSATINTPGTTIITPTRQPRTNQVNSCEFRGIVSEMRGVDDCEFVISLENGDRIVPVEIERDFFTLHDQQLVILAYRPSTIRIGCQLGTPVVVTCIQEI